MQEDYIVKTLGKTTIKSPIELSSKVGDGIYDYIQDSDRVLYDVTLNHFNQCREQNIDIKIHKKLNHVIFQQIKTKSNAKSETQTLENKKCQTQNTLQSR